MQLFVEAAFRGDAASRRAHAPRSSQRAPVDAIASAYVRAWQISSLSLQPVGEVAAGGRDAGREWEDMREEHRATQGRAGGGGAKGGIGGE